MLGLNRSGVAVLGALILAGSAAGCGSINTNRVDCNVVKLQSEAGRSNAEIASALGVSQDEVASCHPPGAMPSEMTAPPEAAPEGSPSPGESSSGGGSSDSGDSSSSKPPM
jgi:hypothetical protein